MWRDLRLSGYSLSGSTLEEKQMEGRHLMMPGQTFTGKDIVISQALLGCGATGLSLNVTCRHQIPPHVLEVARTINVIDGRQVVSGGTVTHIAPTSLQIGDHLLFCYQTMGLSLGSRYSVDVAPQCLD